MISEWGAVGVFLYLWAKQSWNCMRACFALESTVLGKCCIRAGTSAQYLHVFVMSDYLVHTYTAQETFAGLSWSRRTSEKWQACFTAVTAEVYFLFVPTVRALWELPVLTVPTQPPLDPHHCPWGQDHNSAPPGAIRPCCRTQAQVVGLSACNSLITMPVPGHGRCWIGLWFVGCLPRLTLDLTLSL